MSIEAGDNYSDKILMNWEILTAILVH